MRLEKRYNPKVITDQGLQSETIADNPKRDLHQMKRSAYPWKQLELCEPLAMWEMGCDPIYGVV
jgi:hypothetical protein